MSQTSRRYRPTRRDLLGLGATVAVVGPLAACDAFSTDPADEPGERAQAGADKGREAPMLAKLVEAGDIPPVDQRLPTNPLVVEPIERVGVYGGTFVMALDENETAFLYVTSLYDNLVNWRHWNTDWNGEVVPNVAEEFEVGQDGREYVFHLHAGMKWSDGEPFTADDIVFALDDVFFNTELHPAPPSWLTSDGEPATVEKVDDRTVRIVFPEPNGIFLQMLATPDGQGLLNSPRHYMEQFHADYNDDIDQVVEAEGAGDWVELFFRMGGPWNWGNAIMPTLAPWRVTTTFGADAERVKLERNPYYWKVDPDGSQLPYVDHVEYIVSREIEATLLQVLNGEVDLEFHRVSTNRNKPVLGQDRESGGYDFFDFISGYMNYMTLSLNLTVQDDVKREVFTNKDFRIGLSHAINRTEVIDTVYQSVGEPWQAAPRPETEFHDEEFATQFTAYDVDLANQHLDAAGYTERDGQNFRLGPDGDRIRIVVEVAEHFEPHWVDTLELVQNYWAEVGVDMSVKQESRSLFDERRDANEHDAGVWLGDGGHWDALLDPRYYLPTDPYSLYGVPWVQWYSSFGEEGQEPPEATRQQIELYRELRTTPDRDEQVAIMRQILDIAKDEFYCMGIALETTSYGVIKNTLRNFPRDNPIRVWRHADFGPSTPAQYFFEDA